MKNSSVLKLILPLLFVGGLISCGGGGESPQKKALQDARLKWAASGLGDYQFSVFRSCFCPDAGETLMVYDDDVLISAWYDQMPIELSEVTNGLDIESQFDQIEEALGRSGTNVTVTYDSEYGFPSELTIDWIEGAVDDEMYYQSSLQTHQHLIAESENNLALWQAQGLDAYEIRIESSSFASPPEVNGFLTLTVDNGVITSAVNDDVGVVDPSTLDGYPVTIERLFDFVQNYAENPEASITAEFDEQRGYPTLVSTNPAPFILDSSVFIRVHSVN